MTKKESNAKNGLGSSATLDNTRGGFAGSFRGGPLKMGKKDRIEEEPQFSTSMFLPSSSPEISPTDQKHNNRSANQRKRIGDMGGDDSLSPTSHPQNKPSIAPWDDPMSRDSIAPWDTGPIPLKSKQTHNNSFYDDSPSQTSPSCPTNINRTHTSDFSDTPYDQDIRRPSVASANTVSSQSSGSKGSTGGKFHKSLKGFFSDEVSGSREASVTNLSAQNNGKAGKGSDVSETPPRPHTPVPPADVTPWAYQNFEDVGNYGAAPVRTNPIGQELQPANNNAASSKDHHHRSLLHRHTKSKEEPPRSNPLPPTSHPARPSTSRESSSTNLPFGRSSTFAYTPTSSSTTLQSARNSSPSRAMTDRDFSDRKASAAKPEKKGLRNLFSRHKHHEKDLAKASTGSERSLQEPVHKNKPMSPEPPPDTRGREISMASTDSGATIRPMEPMENLEKRSTNASKVSHRFPRMHPKRGVSYEGQSAEKARQGSQAEQQQPAGIFSLDTDLDDMSGIISQPKPTSPAAEAAEIFAGPISKDAQGSLQDPAAPAWDAPDSWAVKKHDEDILGALPEVDETGLPAIEEDDGKSYCMRIFRTDSTFATISTSINATVADILQMLAKKSVLQDTIENYHLVLRKHDLSRQLQNGERPVAMQKMMLEQAGYELSDRIEEVGREDNSYLCRFTFTHRKLTGYGSALDKDPGFSKMQKFSHVDLQGRSLVTIPITLYKKATEIISINLSRNLALDVPRDFIQACINLREIKFIGNEAWRLPASLSWASRLTVLDISNNRLEQLKSAELDKLSSLVSIKMANNKLSELPPYFANFRHLRSLLMSSNNFTQFPELICKMKALVDLDISFNKISALSHIGQVTTLERLWVTNNDLKGPFNETFKNMVNLKEIDARFNGITNVDNVTQLPNLEMLLVGHNGISTFAGSFPKLRSLVMDHCPVTSFDIDAPMPTLLSITLASAKLPSFKDSMFDNVPNLQKLNLDKNHFINMPLQIGRLSRLEHFSIAKNPLNTIPPSIGNLTELKFLNLRECNLKSLPSEIWYCLKLETLNVSSNVLESFPKIGTAPPQATAHITPATTPSLSTSPSFEELGKLEDFGHRRPSQASGRYSIGSSPAGSQRKGSIVSGYGQAGRKASVVSKTITDGSMTPVTRKDSNMSQARFTNTFAGSMMYLHLADNRLEDDVFRELYMLPELRSLNLSYNELTDLPQGVLRRFANLTELYLSGNELTTLPSDDLEEGSNLKILHLNANKFQVLPAELCKVHKLAILDLGSNFLKYNVSNWPYDWNWNFNHNLKYLNFSGNKRLEIKPATSHQNSTAQNGVDLTSFSSLHYLRVLGLMDVTLTIPTTPEPTEDRRIRLSASLAGQINYGVADTIGRHEHLSILDMVVPRFRGREEETLVGLFDGQTLSSGGSKVAKFLHEMFREIFIEELSKMSDDDTGPLDALRRTFLSLNRNMAAAATQTIDARENRAPRGAHRSSSVSQVLSQDDLNSGGVATVLYLHQTELFVANVGDAQAMLIQNNAQYKFLTTKHNPAYPRERERIRDAGGYVSRQGKLNDVLEVSRAFGYFQLMPSVIAAPHTLQVVLNDNDEMIVLGSKEFWDFVTPDLAVDVARSEKADVMLAAQKLRDLAMAYGANNKIMVMVMGISDLRKRNNSRLRGTSLSMQPSYGQEDQLFPSKTRKRKGEGVGDSRLARLEEVEPPTGEVAIVFTDIKNSTALWEILPSAMRSAIQMHNELMRRQLRLIGGYEVKTEGDAFMVSFPTCTSALLWCFSCQSHLLDLAWPTEILDTFHCQEKFDPDQNMIYRGLSVRMGIHWGKPVCEQDPITRRMDYFGPMVNRAARISAVADGGQISVSSDFIAEIQRTLEGYADERTNSTGSEDTIGEDAMGNVIRRELRQLSSQGFEVKDLGEKKLKGLENPEYVYLMYPHSLAGRLAVQPGSDKSAEAGQNDPGTLGKDSELNIHPDSVWQLWDLALRLEMLCSTLESPDKVQGLNKPELSLLDRMKTQGGEISDAFVMNLLDHQVTRIETCTNTLQIRHLVTPMKSADRLYDHARPMGDVMAELSKTLKEYADFKRENAGFQTLKEDFRALKEHMSALEESGILGWPRE